MGKHRLAPVGSRTLEKEWDRREGEEGKKEFVKRAFFLDLRASKEKGREIGTPKNIPGGRGTSMRV